MYTTPTTTPQYTTPAPAAAPQYTTPAPTGYPTYSPPQGTGFESKAAEDVRFTLANKAERVRLAEWFQRQGITDFVFTEDDGYESVDAYFCHGGRTYVVEAKNRRITTEAYPTHPFEESKYRALRKAYAQGNHPLFVVFTTTGAVVYNLKTRLDAEPTTGHGLVFEVDERYPMTTMGAAGWRGNQRSGRRMAEIRRDEQRWKDKVYAYQPASF